MSISHMSDPLFVSVSSCLLPHCIHLIVPPRCNSLLLYLSHSPSISFSDIDILHSTPLLWAQLSLGSFAHNACTSHVISSSAHSLLFTVHKKCKPWWDRWWRKPVHDVVVKLGAFSFTPTVAHCYIHSTIESEKKTRYIQQLSLASWSSSFLTK